MADKVIAHAKVTLTVDIELMASWGPDCPMTQVYDQAREEAIRIVTHADGKLLPNVRVTGHNVTAILVTERR